MKPATLEKRLQTRRIENFVGRKAEIQLFTRALKAPRLPFNLLHIQGPGGIGKTTLLQAFKAVCQENGLPVLWLDGSQATPTADSFLRSMAATLEFVSGDASRARLNQVDGRQVLFIDSYDYLFALDGWLREVFLPQLPDETVVVLASRKPLPLAWQTDQGWTALTQHVALDNLDSVAAQELLQLRGVPKYLYPRILAFTHGHPLALSLVADLYRQHGQIQFDDGAVTGIIPSLLQHMIPEVATSEHRLALYAAALVRKLTEPLLTTMLPGIDPAPVFSWLSGLAVVATDTDGLVLFDLVRDILIADGRRHRDRLLDQLKDRAQAYYASRSEQAPLQRSGDLLFDLLYLNREHHGAHLFMPSQLGGIDRQLTVDGLLPGDESFLQEVVARFEGSGAARLAAYWLERQPENVIILRDNQDQIAAFAIVVSLHETDREDYHMDPCVRALWTAIAAEEELPPAQVVRFWQVRGAGQQLSCRQRRLFLTLAQRYLFSPD